jgi:hypothetical protein
MVGVATRMIYAIVIEFIEVHFFTLSAWPSQIGAARKRRRRQSCSSYKHLVKTAKLVAVRRRPWLIVCNALSNESRAGASRLPDRVLKARNSLSSFKYGIASEQLTRLTTTAATALPNRKRSSKLDRESVRTGIRHRSHPRRLLCSSYVRDI